MRKPSYREFKSDMEHTCRACLNEKYRAKLTPRDCDYLMYPAVCRYCGEVKNIVAWVKFGKRLRIWLRI